MRSLRNDVPRAIDGPEMAPSSGARIWVATRFSKITGAVVEAILRAPVRATARRPASAPMVQASGRSDRKRVVRLSPPRSIAPSCSAMTPTPSEKAEPL